MKRVAQETLTKEHGISANPDAVDAVADEKKKMATSAQMARRKLAQPKSRLNRSTTPTGPPSAPVSAPNPFASAAFGQSQPQNPFGASSGPISFGQTNTASSFPPTNAPQQSSFNVPNGAGFSFTFGSNDNAQPASNPFAAANGAMPNGSNDTMMDASPQKPAASANVFNFGGSTAPPAFAGFGQPSQPQQPPANPFSGLFGQPKPEEPKTNGGGLFGQLTQPQENGASPAKLLFNFGSASTPVAQPEPTSTAPTPKLFSFGQPSSFAPPNSQAEASAAPAKPLFAGFGQSPEVSDSSKEPPAKKPIFSFGTPATAAKEDPPPPSAKPSQLSQGDAHVFGQASSNIFGQPAQKEDKPAATSPNPTADDEPKPNPFAGLFSSQSPTKDAPSASTPKFSFGQTATPQTTTGPSEQSENVSQKTPKPLFDFSASTSSTPKADLFAPKAATPAASTCTPANLFNLNKSAPLSTTPATSSPFKVADHEQSVPATQDIPQSTAPPNPFAFQSQPPPKPDSTHTEKKRRMSDETATPRKALFDTTPKPPTSTAQPSRTIQDEPENSSLSRTVSTFGPPQIPRHLDPLKYKAYDENWRLRALNYKFQQQINSLDHKKHDFMNIVQNYLDHREAIGDGLSGYERPKAGAKRKVVDVDEMQEDFDGSSKRSKQQTGFTAPSAFTPQQPATNSNLFSASPAKPATPASTKTSTLFRSLIPGADSNTPTTKSTTPPSSPPKSTQPQPPKLALPTFGGPAGGSDFMAAFAQSSAKSVEKAAQEAKEKRKLEEFDSDEDDEEEWERKYEEEQRAKKAKIEAAKKAGFVPSFGSDTSRRSESPFTFVAPSTNPTTNTNTNPLFGASAAKPIDVESGDDTDNTGGESGDSADHEDEDEETADDQLPEDAAEEVVEEEEPEEEGEPIPDLDPSQSLFSRISKTTSPNKSANGASVQDAPFKSNFFGTPAKGTPETPSFSSFTPGDASKSPFKPATTFNFSPVAPVATTPSSILGGFQTEVPNKFEGMFGSRPSTPSNADKPKSSFGASSAADNTWKVGSPIKFDTPDKKGGPSIEVSDATPPQKPFQSLFGNSATKEKTAETPSLGFTFAPKPAPGFLSVSSHLDTPGSNLSSRANSPGLTDNESVATDVSTDNPDPLNDAQVNLSDSNPGEENEEVVFEARTKASRIYKREETEGTKLIDGWNVVGKGNMRVLKHNETGKSRIVMRAEPGANILLNTGLNPSMNYISKPSGTKQGQVTFGVPIQGGSVQTWSLLVGTKDKADQLAEVLEKNKVA